MHVMLLHNLNSNFVLFRVESTAQLFGSCDRWTTTNHLVPSYTATSFASKILSHLQVTVRNPAMYWAVSVCIYTASCTMALWGCSKTTVLLKTSSFSIYSLYSIYQQHSPWEADCLLAIHETPGIYGTRMLIFVSQPWARSILVF